MTEPAISPGDASADESAEASGLLGGPARASRLVSRLSAIALLGGAAIAAVITLTALPAKAASPIRTVADTGTRQFSFTPTAHTTAKLGLAAETSLCLAARARVGAAGLPSQSDLAGWVGRTQAALEWTISQLADLRPPPSPADAFAAFEGLLRQEAGLLGQLREAANAARVTTLVKRISAIEEKLERDAATIGFVCGESALGVVGAPPLPSCDAAGVSSLAAKEGICLGSDLAGTGAAVTNVVDAGDTVHMPGYDVRLLATQVKSTHVNNPGINPGQYPDGRGWLVSLELTVTNTGGGPLSFDATGKDTQLSLPQRVGSLSVPESLDSVPPPGTSLARLSPVAAGASVTGWVTFVAPSFAAGELHQRSCDLILFPVADTSGDYLGELRLWKWASPQGRAALGLPSSAQPLPSALPGASVQ